MDDSVSQNPIVRQQQQQQQRAAQRRHRRPHLHQGNTTNGGGDAPVMSRDRAPVPVTEDPRRDAKDPRSRQESEIGLSSFQPTISAKEKTGVDPLSQVSVPLNSIKGKTNIIDSMNPAHSKPTQTKSSIGASWTNHRIRPTKTVGPAETLTRGTLQPPTQVSPAACAAMKAEEEPMWAPYDHR